MKIALVTINFNTKGGSERRTYQLARGLLGAGHEVEIFANRVEDMDLDAGVSRVPMSGGPSFMKILSFTRNVNRALVGRGDIDVVHNQIRPFTDGVVTVGGGCHAEYLRRCRKRLGFLNPRDVVILRMERRRYRDGGCRAVITNSALAKGDILRHYTISPEMVHVAYNGVDLERFRPPSAAERESARGRLGLGEEPVGLFLGSGFERKGLGTAIKALALVRGSEQEIGLMRLVVVGRDDPGRYQRLAARLGVADRLIFAGPTTSPELCYWAADIFILPTAYDPFSNASIEAMACGLPVVTTAQNGVSEIMKDGESGFVMRRPDDHMGLAATLSYLSCGKVRGEAGAAARKTAEGFTWERTLEKTLEVYRAAV